MYNVPMNKKILITVVIAVVFLGTGIAFAVHNNKNSEDKTANSGVVKKESDDKSLEKVEVNTAPQAPTTNQRVATQNQDQSSDPEPQPEVVKPSVSITVAGSKVFATPMSGTHPVVTISIEFNGQVQSSPANGDGVPVQFSLAPGSGVVNVTVTDTVGNTATQSQQIN